MYLIHYKGKCASITIQGIKFTYSRRSANIPDERATDFVNSKGVPYREDIDVIKLNKSDIVPEKDKTTNTVKMFDGAEPNAEPDVVPVTVQEIKKGRNLDEIKDMCMERELDTEGSKTELAERIVAYENSLQG